MTYHSGNQLIDPYFLFEKAQLRPSMHVADLGCGRTGHIVFPAAQIVGETGVVYAVDIMKDVLENIKKRAELENFLNIQPVWANLEKVGYTAIPARSLDVGFIINCLNQSRDRGSLMLEALRLLKEKSRLIIVDWQRRCGNMGPLDELMVNFDSVKDWAEEQNLTIQEEFPVGHYHWGLVLYKHE